MLFSDVNSWIFDSLSLRPLSYSSSHSPSPSYENETTGDGECYFTPVEIWWRDQQKWLEDCGYMLRPRYTPGWIPSWKGTGYLPEQCEDGLALPMNARALDATRISDGVAVTLKVIDERRHPDEGNIPLFLSSTNLSRDPHNHCVPVIEVFSVPNQENLSIIVLPLLRHCQDPDLETVGEATELLRQIFEGLEFMHENLVAHLDPNLFHIMYNPAMMYPDGYHPIMTDMTSDLVRKAIHYTRTEFPPKYYFMDFCVSRQYLTNPASDYIVPWQNNFAPEYKRPEHKCNPFALDVYLLGNMIRTRVLMKYRGLGWLKLLLDDMCQEDPSARPTMAEATTRFEWIIASLSLKQLQARLGKRNENSVVRVWKAYRHYARRRRDHLDIVPPVPPGFFDPRVYL